jgi:hypothetical protein
MRREAGRIFKAWARPIGLACGRQYRSDGSTFSVGKAVQIRRGAGSTDQRLGRQSSSEGRQA